MRPLIQLSGIDDWAPNILSSVKILNLYVFNEKCIFDIYSSVTEREKGTHILKWLKKLINNRQPVPGWIHTLLCLWCWNDWFETAAVTLFVVRWLIESAVLSYRKLMGSCLAQSSHFIVLCEVPRKNAWISVNLLLVIRNMTESHYYWCSLRPSCQDLVFWNITEN